MTTDANGFHGLRLLVSNIDDFAKLPTPTQSVSREEAPAPVMQQPAAQTSRQTLLTRPIVANGTAQYRSDRIAGQQSAGLGTDSPGPFTLTSDNAKTARPRRYFRRLIQWAVFLGVCAIIWNIFLAPNESRQSLQPPPAAQSAPLVVPTATVKVKPTSTRVIAQPTSVSVPPAYEKPPSGNPEHVHTRSQIMWCMRAEIQLDVKSADLDARVAELNALSEALDTEYARLEAQDFVSELEADQFNRERDSYNAGSERFNKASNAFDSDVSDYNGRCASYRYNVSEFDSARTTIEFLRSALVEQAQKEFTEP